MTEIPAILMTQTTTLRFYLLGPMRIERDTASIRLPRRKVESLLAYLLLHPEQHNRDHLATLFWGDSTDAQARHSLRTALLTVRQVVSPDLLLANRDYVQLNPDFPLWTDLHELFDLENEFDYADRDLLNARLALWQGELLAGFYDDWITIDREYYGTRLLKLFLQVTQNLRARSEYGQAIAVAQRMLLLDPANEHAHQHLMFCYVASGDRPAALRQYELCERALADELDAPPMPETVALYHWIKQHDGDEASPAAKITNLPIPLSSFVGRTRETAEIKRLLTLAPTPKGKQSSEKSGAARLLTLIGAGGNGKTRLAIQTATDLIDSFAHGVWWVELAALNDRGLVARAVAKVLGVREVVGQSVIQSVADFVGDKRLLLVIDNCEHLIEPCAQIASALLERCPNLQMLATSREPLNITGEILWQVPTFAVPDPAKLSLVDILLQFESLRLFTERAATVQPGFTLTPENAKAVVEICRRLDGIPLAIELAAARVKLLTVEQIATYLTRALGARFELLTQGSRAAMPRHQTLRATIDWSYDLLDEAERLLFRQVAVFRGGFTLELLEKIVAADPQRNRRAIPNTLDLLAQLVDKSLVIVEGYGEQNRYRLLETLREYALEQFPSVDELQRLQQQHAQTLLHLAEAFDKFHQEELNASILDASMVILEKNLSLPIPTEIRGRIGEDGTLTISLDEIKAVSQIEFNKIHDTIGEMKDTLTKIDEQQDVIVDYIKDQELMKKKAEESQLKLDAAKASLTIITTIAGQIDPKVAKQISVVGNSTLQVGQAINGWLKAVSGLKGLDKVASLSTVVMTGNVLGAIMNEYRFPLRRQ